MKLIAACKKCSAQYDVSDKTPGTALRCPCGGVVMVPQPRIQEARLVRCASCGAVRGSDGSNCDFCGARFSAVDKGWNTLCPTCFCRLPNDAAYCVECGLKLNPQKLPSSESPLPCPRCKTTLAIRQLSGISLYDCGACGGMWAPEQTFNEICAKKETLAATHNLLGNPGQHRYFELTQEQEVKYIPCPICRNLMNRHNFAHVSGVIIDTCRDHGVWLDNQELYRIVKFIEGGGLERGKEFEQREEHFRTMAVINHPSSKPLVFGPVSHTVRGNDLVRDFAVFAIGCVVDLLFPRRK